MEHLEGRQSVIAALAARHRKFQVILVAHGTHEQKLNELLPLATEQGVAVKYVDRRELDDLAHGGSHGGVMAVVSEKPRATVDQLLEMVNRLREPPLLLLLEGVDDSRNLGFTLRTAEAVGVHAVLIKKHLWDFDAVEVARPASGAYERLMLVQIEDVAVLKTLQKAGLKVIGSIAGTRRTMYDWDLTQGVVIALGGEKRGLSGAVRSICDGFMAVPMRGGAASSLSMSHAGAIVLGEVMRQRLGTSRDVPLPPHLRTAPLDEGDNEGETPAPETSD